MAQKVVPMWDVAQVQPEWLRILVHNHQRELVTLARCVNAIRIGRIARRKVDLCRLGSEIRAISTIEPVRQSDWSFGVRVGPIGRDVDAVAAKDTKSISGDQATGNITVSGRGPLGDGELGARVVDVDQLLHAWDEPHLDRVRLVVLRVLADPRFVHVRGVYSGISPWI